MSNPGISFRSRASGALDRQGRPVDRPFRAAVVGGLLLQLVLAGCAGGPGKHASRAPDWESPDYTAVSVAPTPAPALAATPASELNALAARTQFSGTWIPLALWCRANGLQVPQPLTAPPATDYRLNTSNGTFQLRVGSRLAHWNGLEVRLAFAPHPGDGQPEVHTLDLRKTIQPLLLGTSATFLNTNLVVVIDPGHGGADSGASSVLGSSYEKEFTLDWARRLGSLLASNGWQVFLTRSTDTDLPLASRVAFAEAHNAGVFISLHFNSSAPNDQQSGLETYCLTPTGMPSSVTREFGDDPGLAFPNNAFDTLNLQLALRVHRAVLQVNGRRDRGVRRARFLGVLRGQHCAAILVEGGYLSNPQEARLIANPAYRQKLAEAVAQALE